MPKYVVDIDHGMKRILAEMKKAKANEVVIGLQQGTRTVEGVDIATYAAYNEYGTKKIPERSFMRSTFDEEVKGIQKELNRQFGLVMDGTKNAFNALGYCGLKHQEQIKEKIVTLRTPPNAEETIERKGSDNPLIEHGTMLASVRYIVRPVRNSK